jgi:hypothetical protein
MGPTNFNLRFKHNQTDIYCGLTAPQFLPHYQTDIFIDGMRGFGVYGKKFWPMPPRDQYLECFWYCCCCGCGLKKIVL